MAIEAAPVEHTDARPAMSVAGRVLFRVRFVLLGLYLLVLASGVCLICAAILDSNTTEAVLLAVFLLSFLGTQFLFIRAAPHLRWPRPVPRRSMLMAVLAACLLLALLTLGVPAALMSLIQWWRPIIMRRMYVPYWPLLVVALVWAAWLVVFSMMWADEWRVAFRRLYGMLVAGTWLELLITIPVDAVVRRRTDCWCGEGSFFALVLGIAMVLWTFGPGIVMLMLARRMQRLYPAGTCRQCGYDLRGLPEPRCPECGTAFGGALLTDSESGQ